MTTLTKDQALYIAAILAEMKRQLVDMQVSESAVNTALINTCGNLLGNAYDVVVDEVLGENK